MTFYPEQVKDKRSSIKMRRNTFINLRAGLAVVEVKPATRSACPCFSLH